MSNYDGKAVSHVIRKLKALRGHFSGVLRSLVVVVVFSCFESKNFRQKTFSKDLGSTWKPIITIFWDFRGIVVICSGHNQIFKFTGSTPKTSKFDLTSIKWPFLLQNRDNQWVWSGTIISNIRLAKLHILPALIRSGGMRKGTVLQRRLSKIFGHAGSGGTVSWKMPFKHTWQYPQSVG